MCPPRRTIAWQKSGRVHGAQVSRPRVTNDDRLDAIESVNADDLGLRHYCKPTAVRVRGSAEASAKALRRSRAARTQHHQHALTAMDGVDSRNQCGSAVTAHNEIDRSGHRVAL